MTSTPYDPKDDVKYALRIADGYLGFLRRFGIPVRGSRILELGPGQAFGSALILKCLGAKCAVADKYLSAWNDQIHPAFYAELLNQVPRYYPNADTRPIQELISHRSYDSGVIRCIPSTCENLEGVADRSFDVVFSNAVMEHVENPITAFKELLRVTANGGVGIHQIDYRDHRHFDRPLEYLLMESSEFNSLFKSCRGECGNRMRAADFIRSIRDSGFIIDAIEHNMFAEPAYLDSITQRVTERGLKFSFEDLFVLSGRVYLVKPKDKTIQESAFCRSGKLPDLAGATVKTGLLSWVDRFRSGINLN